METSAQGTESGVDSRRGDRRWALLVAVVAALLLAPGAFVGLSHSKVIVGGMRVLDGEVPYRDFWSMYAPGMYYAVALLFGVFGRALIVQGLATVAVRAVSAGLIFAVLRRVGLRKRTAALASLAFTAASFQFELELEGYVPAQMFILAALDRVLAWAEDGRHGRLCAGGAYLGLAACFKHDVAAYAAVAIGVGLVLAWFVGGGRRPAHWLNPLRSGLRIGAGCLAVLVPVVALLAWQAGPDAWQCLIVYPSSGFLVVRDEEFPNLASLAAVWSAWAGAWGQMARAQRAAYVTGEWLLSHLPELVFLAGFAWVLVRRRQLAPVRAVAALVCLAGLPLFWMAAHVQTNTHVYSMALLGGVLGAVVWSHGERGGGGMRRAAIGAIGAVYLGALLVFPLIKLRPVLAYARAEGLSPGVALPFEAAAGLRVFPRERDAKTPIIEFVRENTGPDEPIYVGVTRHDAIVIGDESFYALSGRRCAVRYNELHPGVVDLEETQREMIADLEEQAVRCVILWDFGRDDPKWSKALDEIKARRMSKLESAGSELLDDYLREHFEVIAEHGDYLLLWRRGIPAPG